MSQVTTRPGTTGETIEPAGMPNSTSSRLVRLVRLVLGLVSRLLTRYSLGALRISLGLVFLGFGVLKFFPGASPAEPLVMRTLDTLTFGLVAGRTAVLVTAVAECFIGLTLITGRFLRLGLIVLAGAMVGIMSPVVLFFADLFPQGTPTLEAQYVLKDVVLIAAGLVIAARVLGARLVLRPTA